MSERTVKLYPEIQIATFAKEQPFTPGRQDEDASLVLRNEYRTVVFIVDGGTSLSTFTSAPADLFTGYFAANTAVDGIKKNFPVYDTAYSLLLSANEEIGNRLKEKGVDPDGTDSEFLPTCGGGSLILINNKADETQVAQIGDTAVILVLKDGTVKVALPPSINYEDIKAYKLAKEISETNGIAIKEAFKSKEVTSMLALGRHKENLIGGYGALNGKGEIRRFIKSKIYKTSDITRIIALTDGMIPPQKQFGGLPNWGKIAKEIVKLGPEKFYQEKVLKVKESDPDLTKFPRFKKYDDARLIEIKFT